MFRKAYLPLALVVGTTVIAASMSWAANSPIVVNTTGDSPTATCPATCTLRAAITAANGTAGPDVITFSITGTISPTSSLPAITEAVTITGAVGGSGTPSITIDGGGTFALLNFSGGSGTFTVSDVILTRGRAALNSRGGAIFFNPSGGASTLNLNNVQVTNSSTTGNATADGGGIAIMAGHSLFFTEGAVIGNSTASTMNGGGIYNAGFVKLDGVTVSGNNAGNNTVMMVSDGIGGGLFLASTSANADLRNCTFSANSADRGGAIGSIAGVTATSSMRNCTLTLNTAENSTSGAIDLQGSENSVFKGIVGSVFTSNIVAGNTANGVARNCAIGFTYAAGSFAGFNLSEEPKNTGSCSFDTANDVSGNPNLDVLADYGGLAQTHRLKVGSAAIDKGNPSDTLQADARGAPRADGDETGGVAPDIGAYEFGGFGVVEFGASAYSVKENVGSLTVDVRRYGDTTDASFVTADTVTQAAGAGHATTADFTSTNAALNWAAGDGAVKTFNVPITNDTTVEGTETLNLVLSGLKKGADFGAKADTVPMSILDFEEGSIQFDDASGTVSPANPPNTLFFAIGENGTPVKAIKLSRTGGTDGDVSVTFTTGSGGSATAGTDYTAGSQTVTWLNGEGGLKTVVVPITDDTIYEDASPGADTSSDQDSDPETVNVSISSPTCSGVAVGTCAPRLGSRTAAVMQINDNDTAVPGTVQLSSATYSANEGGTLTVTLKRINGDDRNISVNYATSDGTATAPADYTSKSGTLTWAHDDSADKTFTVPISTDALREADETFNITLSNLLPAGGGATGPTQGTPFAAVATIASAQKAQFQFSASSYSAPAEGSKARVTVKLVGPALSDTVLVDLSAADDTAGAGDYTFSPNPMVLTFPAGTTSVDTDIQTTADAQLEYQEQFKVSIASHDGEAEVVAPSTDVPVIIPGSQQVQFSATQFHSTGESGVLTFGVQRTNGSTGTVSVDYAVSPGTASLNADYTVVGGTSGTLSWGAGDTSTKFIDINIASDRIVEQPDETILLSLSNPTNALVSTTAGSATAFITDDDIDLAFGAAPSATEGSPMTVTVKRVGVATGAVSVNYATSNGTAVAGTDYTTTSGTLNWANGDVADKTFSVPTTNNTKNNVNKTINLTLSSPSANADAGPPATTVGTITDDDSVTVSFSAASQSVGENAGMVTVTAVRTGTTDFDISIPFTVSGTATAADHAAADGVITIPAGATSGSYTFLVSDDAIDEPNETVVLTMGTPTGGSVSAASPSVHTVTITDNDAVTVAFSAATQTVAESAGTVTVTATRTGATTFDISVPYTVSGTAANPADHNAAAGTLTIPAGASSASFTFTVADDAVDEPNETVVVTMGTPSGGDVSAAAPAAQTITITDNDAVTVSFTAASQTVSEKAGSVSVTVRRTGATTFNVSVPYTVSGTATNPADHNAASGSVTIPAGAIAANITFAVANDAVHESSETAIFTLGTPSGGDVTATSPTTHTVTINDDDAVQITAGENSPGVVVTPSGNVAAAGGGGSFSWSALLGLVGLGALRRRGARRFAPLLALLALVPGLAQAATPLAAPAPLAKPAPAKSAPAGAFSYSGIDARYLTVHVKDPGTSASGTALGYTHTVGDKIFMGVGYSSISTGDFTVQGQTGNSKTTSLSVTLGVHRPITPTLDFSGAVDYMYGEAKAGGAFVGGNTEKGWGLEGGVRGRYSPQIEWGVALNYVSIFGSSDTSLSARGLYHFGASPFGLAAGLGFGSQSTSLNLGLRYEL